MFPFFISDRQTVYADCSDYKKQKTSLALINTATNECIDTRQCETGNKMYK